MSNLNPEQSKPSKEAAFLTSLFDGVAGSQSPASQEAVLTQKVSDAIATLDSMKQVVINHRYGLGGHPVLTYDEIARLLTTALSDELRASIARDQGVNVAEVVISVERVRELETEALRNLRSPKKTT